MKLLLDIKDDKAAFFLELLKNFPFIKATEITEDEPITLSKEQKAAIDKGIETLDKGETHSHEQMVRETKERYPKLFK